MKTTRKILTAALIVTFSAGGVLADRSDGPRGRTGGFESTPIRMPREVRDFREYESGAKLMGYLRCMFSSAQECEINQR
ncbi:MAG TPA: hypothetical protein ENK28_12325 [Aliiroseovarius sp.]|nr:hypothetical protein [Aliiroseovarius sp.]